MNGEERFRQMVAAALDDLPEEFASRLDNVAVVVEDDPPPDARVLGLYQGVPLLARGVHYNASLPDQITIYRHPIERVAVDDADLEQKVRHVVFHEIAHHFGISDDRLREIGKY